MRLKWFLSHETLPPCKENGTMSEDVTCWINGFGAMQGCVLYHDTGSEKEPKRWLIYPFTGTGNMIIPASHFFVPQWSPETIEMPDVETPNTIKLNGIERIAAEQARQRTVKGYDAAHDDLHDKGELAITAACFAAADYGRKNAVVMEFLSDMSLFGGCEFKQTPSNRLRELEKAGALIASEIDRILRILDEA